MNPADARPERADPKAYQAKLKGLLGGRDPLDVLARTPEIVADLVRPHGPDVMQSRPFAGKWTPNEILGHLCDTEWVFGYRLRLILCEERPTILGMDQELWVMGQRHNEREPSELLAMFTDLRRCNLLLWRRLSSAELRRTGRHSERGDESLDLMLRMEAGHDLSHIDQLTRYLAAVGSR